jgi:hypothetical protein
LYVTDRNGKTVWEAHYPSFYESNGEMLEETTIFEDGFMKNAEDTEGLEFYLKSISVINKDDKLVEIDDDDDDDDDKDDEYAAGGTIESKIKKRLKNAFELPIQVAVYVPSTRDKDIIITKREMEARVEDVQRFLANAFGGFSAVKVEGGFESSDKGLIQEDAVRVVAFASKENENGVPFEQSFESLMNQVKNWCSKWSQQSIGVEFENDLFYVDTETKFADGGYMAKGGEVDLSPYKDIQKLNMLYKSGSKWYAWGKKYNVETKGEGYTKKEALQDLDNHLSYVSEDDEFADGGEVKPKLVKFDSMYDGLVDAYESVNEKGTYFYVGGEQGQYVVTQESEGFPATEAYDDWLYSYEDALNIAKKLASGEDLYEFADGGLTWYKYDNNIYESRLGNFDIMIYPETQRGYWSVYVLEGKNKVGAEFDIYGIKNAKDKAYSIIRSQYMADGGSVAEGNLQMLRSNAKAIKHHAEELEGELNNDTEVEAWVVAKGERAATDLSDITHYLDGKKFSLGGMTAGRWYRDNSGEEFKFIGKIDSGENKGRFLFSDGKKSVYKELDDFEGGRPKETKLFGFFEDGGDLEEGVDLFEDYDEMPASVIETLSKYDLESGDYRELEKALKDLKKYGYTFEYELDGQPYDLRKIGQKGKSEFYAKGGSIKSLEKRVAEVNELIKRGNELGIEVVDEGNTWQAPMKYKPLKYTNGVLYISYEVMDLYKYNREYVQDWEKKSYKIGKYESSWGHQGEEGSAQREALTEIARMYRKPLKSYDTYGYFEDGGEVNKVNPEEIKVKIEQILDKVVPSFYKGVSIHKNIFDTGNNIRIFIAASDYKINGVSGQLPQVVSLSLDLSDMDLHPQVFGGNGGQRVERKPNMSDPNEKYLAMKGVKVPFRTPQPNEKAVLDAIKRFAENYKKTLAENREVLLYQDVVDYDKLLAGSQYADGGMMAEGGEVAKKGQVKIGDSIYKVFYNDWDGEEFSVPFYANSEKEAISKFKNKYPHIEYTNIGHARKINTSTNYDIFEEMREYADGGMMAKGGEIMKHKHNEHITIELIEPTNKGWKVKQIETHSIGGRKLSTPKEKVAYFSKEELTDLFEPTMAKGGVIASSPTKEGIEKLIGDYYYSKNISLKKLDDKDEYEVSNSKGKINGVKVIVKKGRYQFVESDKMAEGGMAKGGEVEKIVNTLYSRYDFINDDYNWKSKLLEMLGKPSYEAYEIYQSLNNSQKKQVLQELYEMDNDMGSDGDGDIETSKENLEILLDDSKNAKPKLEKGGTFAAGVKAIEKRLVGTKVNPKYQKDYGKTYDKAEAHEAASKIKGKMRAMELANKYKKKKLANGGRLGSEPKVDDVVDFGEGLERITRIVKTPSGKQFIEAVQIDGSSDRRNLYDFADWEEILKKQEEYKKSTSERELYREESDRLRKESENLDKEKAQKYNDIDGFGEDLTPMQKARVLKYLNKETYTKDGKELQLSSVKDELKKVLKKDWYIRPFNGEDTIMYKEGNSDLILGNVYQTKTAREYLQYLKSNNKMADGGLIAQKPEYIKLRELQNKISYSQSRARDYVKWREGIGANYEDKWNKMMKKLRGWNAYTPIGEAKTRPEWKQYCKESGLYEDYDFGDVLA